jgi:crotonobetainyl-CoA:carnitine CoA-transferase CaiB-like acyl-CoA transferase
MIMDMETRPMADDGLTEALAAAYPDPKRRPGRHAGILAGVRVADFCWMGVGACATAILADYGAEVIRIEDRDHLDLPRRLPYYKRTGNDRARTAGEEAPGLDPNKGGLFNNYNRNKLGVTINMRDPDGAALAERLISASSVVTENFAPGVMERWGLTYERLQRLSPEVIFARMSGFGHSGPQADYRAYGPVVQAVAGLTHISGLPGREPSGWGLSYMDKQGAFYNAAALIAAVYNRDATGRGTEIDVAAVEAGINLLGPILLDVDVNKRSTRGPDFPLGNRIEHPTAAPHGVYPCLGRDRWIAISVFTDCEWRALCKIIGLANLANEPRFLTAERRVAEQDALDAIISQWTRQQDRHVAMHRLQVGKVPAGAVQTAEDINERDPQLASRGVFFELDHPVIGEARFEGTPIRFSRTRQDNWRSAPLVGEDNAYVFRGLLGLPDDEYGELVNRGVI